VYYNQFVTEKKMTLKKTASVIILSISFLAASCGSASTENDATTEGTDSLSTTVMNSCSAACDKNKGCTDECKKNCDDPSKCANSANCTHGEMNDSTMEDEHACEEGACMPGACGGGE
jgi:hypothetical protein